MTNLSDINFSAPSSASLGSTLSALQQDSKENLNAIAVPTRKTEAWKYSAKYLKLPETFPTLSDAEPAASAYELDCQTITLKADGNISFDSKGLNQLGIEATPFSALNDEQLELVTNAEKSRPDTLIFAKLNSALFQNGLFLNVSKNTQVEKALKVIKLASNQGVSTPRIFVRVESGADLTLIEEIVQTTVTDEALISEVSDIRVEANANVKYLRMNITASETKHVGLTNVDLLRDARFNSYCLGLGSAMGRHDLRVSMLEAGAECELNGVCVTTGKQHYDNHTCIEHIAPHCTSNETYRCIAGDQSHIVFNGRIHIHKDAQKTLGDMSNKNLLLSSDAEIDSKPELEIYADDVKCAHGTTIGQLDETELYYLQTRGVAESQAKLMLTLGFVLEIVRATPIESIAQYWEKVLSDLLSYQGD